MLVRAILSPVFHCSKFARGRVNTPELMVYAIWPLGSHWENQVLFLKLGISLESRSGLGPQRGLRVPETSDRKGT